MTQTRWTKSTQELAEKMKAAGATHREIAAVTGFASSTVQRKLKPNGDEENRQRNRNWYRGESQRGRLSVINPLFKERNPNYDPRRIRGGALFRRRGTTI